MRARPTFLRWLLLQAFAISFFAGFGSVYGASLKGPSLVAVPIILAILVGASAYGGRLAWRVDVRQSGDRTALLHDAEWLGFWSWVSQISGIMATVFGVWHIVQSSNEAGELVAGIQNGLGVALTATFVGLASSLVLEKERRLIEAELGP